MLSSFAVSALIQALTYGTVSRKGRDCINDTKTIKPFAFSRASKLCVLGMYHLSYSPWLGSLKLKQSFIFIIFKCWEKGTRIPVKFKPCDANFLHSLSVDHRCNSFQFTFFPKILCQHLELGKLFNFFCKDCFWFTLFHKTFKAFELASLTCVHPQILD